VILTMTEPAGWPASYVDQMTQQFQAPCSHGCPRRWRKRRDSGGGDWAGPVTRPADRKSCIGWTSVHSRPASSSRSNLQTDWNSILRRIGR
jgi:hypothetical protein